MTEKDYQEIKALLEELTPAQRDADFWYWQDAEFAIGQYEYEKMKKEAKKMKNVIWFSRHQPSAEQLTEIAGEGSALVGLDEGIALGSRSIDSEEDRDEVIMRIRELARKHSAHAIYGVFPAPVLGVMCSNYVGVSYDDTPGRGLHCFSAWNVTRAKEGEEPSFEHKKFVFVGMLYAGSDE